MNRLTAALACLLTLAEFHAAPAHSAPAHSAPAHSAPAHAAPAYAAPAGARDQVALSDSNDIEILSVKPRDPGVKPVLMTASYAPKAETAAAAPAESAGQAAFRGKSAQGTSK